MNFSPEKVSVFFLETSADRVRTETEISLQGDVSDDDERSSEDDFDVPLQSSFADPELDSEQSMMGKGFYAVQSQSSSSHWSTHRRLIPMKPPRSSLRQLQTIPVMQAPVTECDLRPNGAATAVFLQLFT